MSKRSRPYCLQTLVVLIALLIAPLQASSFAPTSAASASTVVSAAPDVPTDPTGLYRTRVAVADSARRARLDKLGVRVLTESAEQATVLADGDQL